MLTLLRRCSSLFFQPVSHRTQISKTAVQSLSIVENLDVIEQILPYIVNCSMLSSVKKLFFQTGEETLHAAVVIRASRLAHAAPDPVLLQHLLIWSLPGNVSSSAEF